MSTKVTSKASIGRNQLKMLRHVSFGAFVSSWRQILMADGYTIDGKRKLSEARLNIINGAENELAWLRLANENLIEENTRLREAIS